jgi:Mg2+ and Co2+ transporter CorA
MKYCTDDGKHIFDTEDELVKFEEELVEKEKKKQELRQQKENRLNAIYKASKDLEDMIKEYEKDYNEILPGKFIKIANRAQDFPIQDFPILERAPWWWLDW